MSQLLVDKEIINIVWFKRDLRIHDHGPLSNAAQQGKVLPLYIVEPDYWNLPDSSARQWQFISRSLVELNKALTNLGQGLYIVEDNAISAFELLRKQFTIAGLYSHQESGNLWTFQRDKSILKWCSQHNIQWHESLPYGVFRRYYDRDGWAGKWEQFMAQPCSKAPEQLVPLHTSLDPFHLPEVSSHCLVANEQENIQQGGRYAGIAVFNSFLSERGKNYSRELSSPLSATQSCSRLSPHLSFGTLSIREIHQKIRSVLKQSELNTSWKRSLRAFDGRLHWHCHFIQKLETEPEFEVNNMLPVFNGLREDDFNALYFEAWQKGETGFPLVDACMKSLRHTGWLNFRMRAMLVSFASYQLWLHWQRPAWHLAQCFTDYEPGIHYCQMQMQSGTTGINALRMYNPIKQSQDQDPKGLFIRRWLPELHNVPLEFIHEPWKMPLFLQKEIGCIIGIHYPEPIVDHMQAIRAARAKFSDLRKGNQEYFDQAKALFQKHGSRRKRGKRMVKQKKTSKKSNPDQLNLFGSSPHGS